MKAALLLPLAALATAFVIPDEQVLSQLEIETQQPTYSILEEVPSKDELRKKVESTIADVVSRSKNVLDHAFEAVVEAGQHAKDRFQCMESMTAFDPQAWLESSVENNPFSGIDEEWDHPHKRPHKGPHKGHRKPHHKTNLTVYQLIAESKYTTKLAALINEDEDLVKILNGTEANYTVFAPIDKAFEKLPHHHHKPSKELIKKVLLYHVSPDFYPAGRVLISHTIPSAVKEATLGDQPQRLRLGLNLKGLTVNFFSRIIAVNIFGTNGVIHGVDSLIFPPPPTLKIIELLPNVFSTLELGLHKTGLFHDFSVTAQAGGTFFAPSNTAFTKLGPKINAFLFSHYGEKYLKALLKYHVVSNTTLYSDAFYPKSEEAQTLPKGLFHVDLPTLLDGKILNVDVARFAGFISIKINGFSTVTTQDGIAKDGVLQVVSNVLIPPKKVGGEEDSFWQGEELEVDDLVARLAPFVEAQPEL
ncbi:MAG: hypothetical protein M1838_003150 [Thelocarpon superellum]|nr:MAG: hypothetical protein M1838_003150 [Thelocarpon superellum]